MEDSTHIIYAWVLLISVGGAALALANRHRLASTWRREYRCTRGIHRRRYSEEVYEDSGRPTHIECGDCLLVLEFLPRPAADPSWANRDAIVAAFDGETESEVHQIGDWGDPLPFDSGDPVLIR